MEVLVFSAIRTSAASGVSVDPLVALLAGVKVVAHGQAIQS